MSFCLLKEKSLCLSTSYKAKDVFIRSSDYYWVRCRITQFARESVGLAPFVVRT